MTTRRMRLAVVVAAVCLGLGAVDALAETAAAAAGGTNFTCAVTAGGGVQCWGQNMSGQLGDGTTTSRLTPVPVSGLSSGVVAVATGQSHACALTSGGAVLCWGSNFAGQLGDGTTTDRLTPTPVSGLGSGAFAISAASNHTCAVAAGRAAKCWGRNSFGQIGDNSTTDRLTPAQVTGLTSGVLSIAAGYGHSCAVAAGGAAMCWGYNALGLLGDGTTTNRLTPVAVSGLSIGVSAIAAGSDHTCAVAAGGAAVCWGDNTTGELGDGTTTGRLTPTPVVGLSVGVLSIAANRDHTLALTTGGVASSWGFNYFGQVGDGTTTNRSTPTPVVGLSSGVSSIAAGHYHTCAVTGGGEVTCWGLNNYGELGDGTTVSRPTATPVMGAASGMDTIAAGSAHTCAVTAADAVQCWGSNNYGQIGDGTTTFRMAPAPVSGLSSGVEAVATGASHSCAVAAGGAALCWGSNSYGQLGDGTTVDRWTPTAVNGLSSGVLAIAAGSYHTCALIAGGAMQCWGRNNSGQLGDNTTADHLLPAAVSGLSSGVAAIAAGYLHSCAVTTAGAAKCWGDNQSGQIGDWTYNTRKVPTDVYGLATGIAAIAAGRYHTCAQTTGGGALCWGYNYYGQLGDGMTTTQTRPVAVSGLAAGVAALTVGGSRTCARTTGGAALCWGDNYWGGIGDGTTTNRPAPAAVLGLESGVASLTTGDAHTCAVTTGGAALCWGGNNAGQLGTGARVVGQTPLAAYGFGGAIAAAAVAPDHGAAAGGTVVTITGAYFLQGATVTIGGVSATQVSVISTTALIAVTGPHASGAVDVVVTNPDATQATITGGFAYDGAAAPPPRGDFTGDLKSDVVWRHATLGDVWLWPMNGETRTAETYVRTVSDTNWEIRGQGDQDGDGDADLLWRNKMTGEIYFWPMTGTIPDAEIYVGTVDPAYDIVGTGDFDGDRRSDILWRHTTNGEVWIWLMNGPVPLSQVWVDTVDPAYVVKGVGDLDANTKADIVWHHATQGEVWVWLMDGTTRLDQVWVGSVPDVGYQIAGVADVTGEGKADLVWHHATLGEVWIWTMNGASREAETWVGTVPDTNYQIAATGDYNGDTKADLLWRNVVNGEVWVWLMNGPVKLSETWVATVPDTGYQIIK